MSLVRSTPVGEPLLRAAQELERMAHDADRLGGRLAELAGGDMAAMEDIQRLDLLGQQMAGLAAFLTALAATAPADLLVDAASAAEGLTLAEQARRLGGRTLASTQIEEGLTLFTD